MTQAQMAQPAISPDRLPRWVVLVGSVLIVFHLIAVLALALAVPSGPWPTSFGASMSEEPRFVRIINELTAAITCVLCTWPRIFISALTGTMFRSSSSK